MRCPTCGDLNRAGAKFCAGCGAALNSSARNSRLIPIRLLVLLLVVLSTAISYTMLAFSPAAQQMSSISAALNWLSNRRSVTTRESVVQGIQGMSELASAKYTIQTIVEVSDTGALGPLTSDRILLRADAQVLAGIDLSLIKAEQVQISGDSVTLTLPPPTLVSNEITYHVYDRRRGWFASTNKDLQTAAEQQARLEIVQTACQKGILKEAQTNAEATLRLFLVSLGFAQATFVATAPDAKACS